MPFFIIGSSSLVGGDGLRALVRAGIRFRGNIEQLGIVVEEIFGRLVQHIEDLRRFLIVLQLEVGSRDTAQGAGERWSSKLLPHASRAPE